MENSGESYFLRPYLEMCSTLTDADPLLNTINGLHLLSRAIGRKPIKIVPKWVYPNLWTIVIGKSSITRKTSSWSIAQRVLPIKDSLAAEFTPESLLEILELQLQGTITKDEISGFFESMKKRDYMTGMGDLQMILYDCPNYYDRTLKSHHYIVENVCFNIAGFTTYSRFKDTVEVKDYTSGYLIRYLLVPISPPSKFRGRRTWTVEDDKKIEDCIKKFNDIQKNLEGIDGFSLSAEAFELFNDWEISSYEEASKTPDDEENSEASQMVRLADHVLKLACLFEVDSQYSNLVSSKPQSILISTGSVSRAIDFVKKILDIQDTRLTRLLDNCNSDLDKLKRVIEKLADVNGWALRSTLHTYMNINRVGEFDKIINLALEAGLIDVKREGRTTYYRLR